MDLNGFVSVPWSLSSPFGETVQVFVSVELSDEACAMYEFCSINAEEFFSLENVAVTESARENPIQRKILTMLWIIENSLLNLVKVWAVKE